MTILYWNTESAKIKAYQTTGMLLMVPYLSLYLMYLYNVYNIVTIQPPKKALSNARNIELPPILKTVNSYEV